MNSGSNTAVIAYVPAPHRGYLELFRKYRGTVLHVLGADLIDEFPSLRRHLPGADPADAARMVGALDIFSRIAILSRSKLEECRKYARVVMPDEDVMRTLAERYFADVPISFDGTWRLRWDWGAATADRVPESAQTISVEEFDRKIMRAALKATMQSPDWWRQVGAMVIRDGKPLVTTYNRHLPHEQSAYVLGDPRSNFGPGEHIDASLALHAEEGAVAEMARRGLSTEGCDLYVTTFPCGPCARLCAASGFKRLFYATGYSRVDGDKALLSHGVEIIRVQL